MEEKSLSVNDGKARIMWCKVSMAEAGDSREHLYGVCRKGVGDNSSYVWIVLYRWPGI